MSGFAVVVRRGGRTLPDHEVDRLICADDDFHSPFVCDTEPAARACATAVQAAIWHPFYVVTVEPVAVARRKPYHGFVVAAFDRTRHNAEYRRMVRWLYRQFRKQKHSTPFTARAQIASFTMMEQVSR